MFSKASLKDCHLSVLSFFGTAKTDQCPYPSPRDSARTALPTHLCVDSVLKWKEKGLLTIIKRERERERDGFVLTYVVAAATTTNIHVTGWDP